jgi:hypothetical protein
MHARLLYIWVAEAACVRARLYVTVITLQRVRANWIYNGFEIDATSSVSGRFYHAENIAERCPSIHTFAWKMTRFRIPIIPSR